MTRMEKRMMGQDSKPVCVCGHNETLHAALRDGSEILPRLGCWFGLFSRAAVTPLCPCMEFRPAPDEEGAGE